MEIRETVKLGMNQGEEGRKMTRDVLCYMYVCNLIYIYISLYYNILIILYY